MDFELPEELRMLRDAAPVRRYLMTALGPGFTGAFLTLDRGS